MDNTKIPKVARTTYAESVDDLLSKHDVLIPLVVSPKFMKFANQSIKAALVDHGFPGVDALHPISKADHKNSAEIPVIWRLDNILNWQMLDRRIDE